MDVFDRFLKYLSFLVFMTGGLLDFLKNVCGDDKTAPKWNTFKLAYILLSDISDWKNIYLS